MAINSETCLSPFYLWFPFTREPELISGVRCSRVVTFAAIRLRGPGFKPRPGQKFETRFLLHSHPSGGEGMSPVQGEAKGRHYIKPEYLS